MLSVLHYWSVVMTCSKPAQVITEQVIISTTRQGNYSHPYKTGLVPCTTGLVVFVINVFCLYRNSKARILTPL